MVSFVRSFAHSFDRARSLELEATTYLWRLKVQEILVATYEPTTTPILDVLTTLHQVSAVSKGARIEALVGIGVHPVAQLGMLHDLDPVASIISRLSAEEMRLFSLDLKEVGIVRLVLDRAKGCRA